MKRAYLLNPIGFSIPGLALVLALVGCGGGGGGSSTSTSSSSTTANNQIPITVDSGPAGVSGINQLYASVTLCAPGTTNCQTIDHVLVDTGSYGARFIASAINPSVLAAFPAVSNLTGHAYYECAQFVDGYSWGPLQTADVQMGGELAKNIPIQVIGPAGAPTVPPACSLTGPPENTVQSFGANGILGIGPFVPDCGQRCASTSNNGLYYTCSAGSCTPSTIPIAQQVSNPVAAIGTDGNGTLITLPAVNANGATRLSGVLTFGIGTQSNNGLNNATVLTLNAYGEVNASVDGVSYPSSFLDTGSNGYFLGTDLFPACITAFGFYCPATPQVMSATLQGMNGASTPTSFTVTNADDWFQANQTYAVAPEIAGANPGSGVDWGLPINFAHTVYTAIDGMATQAGVGPWTAIN
jgi:Protein of unknown function (DUF3443)